MDLNLTLSYSLRWLCLLCCVVLSNQLNAAQTPYHLKIGVLAYSGGDMVLKWWSRTAEYLDEQIPSATFTLVPLDLSEMRAAVKHEQLAFVLTNPGNFVELQTLYGIEALATLRNQRQNQPYTQFGAVIFTRADRNDIQTLTDLKGKSFMAVKQNAFGGFQMAWRELLQHNVNPFQDFAKLYFSGFPQDGVAMAVGAGLVDAGTIRTDTLERMAAAGKIDLAMFRILNQQTVANFPFALSTPLYPEWPFAKLASTPPKLAELVANALLTLPDHSEIARAAHSAGWIAPLDYAPVHQLMRDLQIGPYHETPEITLPAVVEKYSYWIFLISLLITLMIAATYRFFTLNRGLISAKIALESEIEQGALAQAQITQLSRVVEQTDDIVFITNREGIIEYVNPGFELATGFDKKTALGKTPAIVSSKQHTEQFYARLWQTITAGGTFHGTFINKKHDGNLYHEEKTITPLKDRMGKITHYVSTGKDVSERMATQEHLDYLAFHDPLTNLPNRAFFQDRLNHAMAKAHRSNKLIALLFLDLDGFKTINDSLGHAIGDQLLKAVAQRLSEIVRSSDTVARLGGDEFTLILEEITQVQQISTAADKILAAFHEPYSIEGQELFITASIGIAIYHFDERSAEDLVRAADTAMYHAKEHGRNNYQFYTAEMTTKVSQRFLLQNQLQRALERNEFIMHYQPIADLATGKIVSVEALIRWQHPELGIVRPNEFVPILEDTNLISAVSEWGLACAANDHTTFQSQIDTPLQLSFNLSPKQFLGTDLANVIKRILRSCTMNPNALILEITENVLMFNHQQVHQTLTALRDLGVQIAIDDFGTGYSSLSYLKQFPIDILKLDQTFIFDMTQNNENTALVRGIIALGRALNLTVVAEGVETPAQLMQLQQHQCDRIQGNLLGQPIPRDKVIDFLNHSPSLATGARNRIQKLH